MAEPVETPHFKLPFTIRSTGKVDVIEQDSIEEIIQNVETALLTDKGSLVDLPNFGIPEQVLRMRGVNAPEVLQSLRESEPRADVEVNNDINREIGSDMISRLGISIKESS